MINQNNSSSLKIVFLLCLTSFFAASCGSDRPLNASRNPRNPFGAGPAAVSLSSTGFGNSNPLDLGSAGNYAVLAKTGVSDVGGSVITGNMGVSPVAASYITGFSLSADASNVFSTSTSVVGKIYAADYAPPTPSNLTTAIGSMQTSYTDAAGRSPPDFNELATGNLGGLTLSPGLYTWSTNVIIPTSMTITGTATDIWIFQVAGNVTMSSAQNIVLGGQALSKNIFWQVAGQVTVGTTSHFEGVILCKTAVTMNTGSTMNGQVFAQTRLNLDHATITKP